MERVFCPYCGCGCTLLLQRNSEGTIEKTLPDKDDPVSRGKPCVKGLTVHEMLNTNRLTTPMMRERKADELRPCTWDQAFSLINKRLTEIAGRTDIRDAVYFVGSGECSNESNYLLSKLCRSHFKSNNIDSCARLCHAATGTAFNNMFGMAAIPTYTIDDIERGDVYLFVGTDPMEDYPVMFDRVLDAKRRGAIVISLDVAKNSTTSQSERSFEISPGGIIPLISHLIVMLTDGNDISRDARQFADFEEFVAHARTISSENPPSTFSFSREDLAYLYAVLKNAKNPVIGFGMGLTQHMNGTQNVYAIAGLALLLDAVLFPNRGKVNIQGAGDVGAEPFWRPNEIPLSHNSWDFSFRSHKGKCMTEGLYDDESEFVWIMGMNPSQSMPDLNALDASLQKKFVVYHHHHPGRTMEYADVVLPTSAISEEYGSITNGERRVRGLFDSQGGSDLGDNRKNTPGLTPETHAGALVSFAHFIGAQGFYYQHEEDIFRELVSVVPGYDGLTLEGVRSAHGQYAQKEPEYKTFHPFSYERAHFQKSGFPFVFTTARNRFQFCSGTGTRCSKTLCGLSGGAYVYMNPLDAAVLKIDDDSQIRIISLVGEIEATVKIDAGVSKRVIVAPFHFEKLLVNRLTARILDPESKTPCYKEIGVRVEKG